MHPPFFFDSAEKECAVHGGRKRRFAQNRHRRRLICLKRGVPTRDIRGRSQLQRWARIRSCRNLQVHSPRRIVSVHRAAKLIWLSSPIRCRSADLESASAERSGCARRRSSSSLTLTSASARKAGSWPQWASAYPAGAPHRASPAGTPHFTQTARQSPAVSRFCLRQNTCRAFRRGAPLPVFLL